MEPLVLEYQTLHLRADRGVFEMFWLLSSGPSFRIPLSWLREYFTEVALLADRRVEQ